MNRNDRRTFLKASLSLGAASLLGGWKSASPGVRARRYSPGSRLNIAFIGVGGQGRAHIRRLAETENLVAFCDVDDNRAAETYLEFPDVPRFRDFRVMLDKKWRELDAVVVATPDHTHFVATMAAMERGLAVLTEKPLTHNIWECRTLAKAAEYYGVVTAMGNQGHATEGIRYVKEWVEAGVLGEVREVLAWFDGPHFAGNYFRHPSMYPLPATPVPSGVDFDLWRGPVTAEIPYHPELLPSFWRGHFAYGNGELGDWACHTLDAPNWALDLGAPVSVELVQHDAEFPTLYVPRSSIVKFEFAARGKRPPVTLTWHDGGIKPANRPEWGLEELDKSGMIMIGSKATLMTGGRPNSPRLIPDADWLDFRKNPPAKTIPRIKGGHLEEWTAAIKGDGPAPGSDFRYACGLTELTLVGVLAQRFGGRLDWDAARMQISNRPELNDYVREPVRPGWETGLSI